VRRTLGRLERDPFDPRLRTRQFRTEELGHVRVTPTDYGDLQVFWQVGEERQTIEIVEIAEVPL
jgi:hypothetical protein